MAMASETNKSYHKRLFLQLIAFSWAMLLCFVGYQYIREKEYKSEFLNAQLQQYNRHLLATIEEGEPYEDYIATHDKPFEELRISIITLVDCLLMLYPVPFAKAFATSGRSRWLSSESSGITLS